MIELNNKSEKKYDIPSDWLDAFNNLKNYIETLPINKKQIIFFDETPWLDSHKSGFLETFEWFWNGYASTKNNLIFIVCGSASDNGTLKITK